MDFRSDAPSTSPAPSVFEWPTMLVAGLIYASWLSVTWFHAAIPPPLRMLAGGAVIAWHGSLQHEAIHRHPTRWPALNRLIAAWPLNIWLPYEQYRRSHLAHHATEHLTWPQADPESRYVSAAMHSRRPFVRLLLGATGCLAGRLILGPAVEIGRFLVGQLVELRREPAMTLFAWSLHLALLAVVLWWVIGVCRIGVAEYLLAFVYPGAALSLLRSFAEHRADPDPSRRIAVVERAPLFGLLFLNNNLHVAHHLAPSTPWYRLPAAYDRMRPAILASGAPVYAGYRDVAARYLFRPHDQAVHPADGWSRAE